MTTLGVVALLLGVLLIVVEAHAPTAGVLGGVGALIFAAGVWLLFTSGDTGQLIAVPVTAGVAVAGLGVAAVASRKVLTARHAPVRTGMQSLIGSDATVRSWSGSQGQVEMAGELWRARMEFGYEEGPAPTTGESVVVERIRGLTLSVRRREPWELPL
ncbi:serine protease [Rhodococcus sp. SRB_17]|uniref:NfeD family protein n=1 Tax=Rhodococcus sp. OK302 TaxID=1882769 RepID=UPI000B940098|nr:NfeD family protein [Rhodococcus sp. OK302]NMM88266.1 serine protease [Rhodococcus sp. SRB_17]OYD67323.1 membrane-bound serine protease (ClpP class) [Rhodococcus sp. OK302]